MKQIGEDVSFSNQFLGKLVDVAEELETIPNHGKRLWRIEKIQNGNESWIRIGYYTDEHKRKKPGFIWANRPPTINPVVFQRLIDKAKKQKLIH
jgi:hypothetical protein